MKNPNFQKQLGEKDLDHESKLIEHGYDLRKILDGISDGLAVLDKNWINIYTNKIAGALLNREPKDLIGKSFWENYPDMKGSAIEASLRNSMEKRQHVHMKYYYEPLDRWFENNFYPSDNGITIIFRDITEKKKAEERLAASENRLRAIFDSEPECIKLLDRDFKLLDINPAGIEMIEADSLKDIQGCEVLTLIDDAFKKQFLDLGERVFNGESGILEFSITGLKGTKRWMEMNAVPLRNSGDEVVAVLSIARDISKRKAHESEIQRSEALLNEAQRIAKTGSWELDIQKNQLHWSAEVFRIFEMAPDKSPASYEAFLNLIHPQEREMVDKIYTDSVKNHTPYELVHRLVFHDGRIKYVQERCETIYTPEGEPIRSLGTVQDISDRVYAEMQIKKKDQQIREISSSMPSVVFQFAVDLLGKRHCNFVGENIFTLAGITVDEICSDFSKFSQQIHPEDGARVKEEVGLSIKSPGYFNSSFRLVDAHTSEIKWVNSSSFTSLQPDGTFIMNGTLTDFTESKRAEEELQRSNLELRQLTTHLQSIREEERTKIARDLHDELGQQLTALKMDASWLSKKLTESDSGMIEKVNGMIALIGDTVQSIRRICSELRPGILDDLGLEDALQWQSREFETRTNIHSKVVSGQDNRKVKFSKDLSTSVFRIYQEALTNVARHSNASEVVTIFKHTEDKILLTVSDNGQGFNTDEVKTKNSLGLLGMKERASGFGGHIFIESARGQGTTISLEMPLNNENNIPASEESI